MRKLTAILLVLAMVAGAACVFAEEAADLTGAWIIEYVGQQVKLYMFLEEDGTFEAYLDIEIPDADDEDDEITGTWTSDGTALVLSGDDGDISLTRDGDQFTGQAEGVELRMYREAEPETDDGGLTGGWQAAADYTLTPVLATLFDKGMDGLVGVSYEPVLYLGSQVVAGTNHAFLCRAVTVVPDAVPYWAVVYLYEDLQGSVSILDISEFDVGVFCTYEGE